MNYTEALHYLNSFIDYEKIGYTDRKNFKLDRTRDLARIFGNPERSFTALHITGTKGKGSTAVFISEILKSAGFRVGLYTSPHLLDPCERICINGSSISTSDFTLHVQAVRDGLAKENLGFSPTFFEIYTILAFQYFRAHDVDFGVIEVGLGGRLDATNIVNALVSVITPISYDHTTILGNDLKLIAQEKCGIIKRNSVCICAPQDKGVLEIVKRKCTRQNSELVVIGRDMAVREIEHSATREVFTIRGMLDTYDDCSSRLLGRHQIVNAACAVGVAEALKRRGARIRYGDIDAGLKNAANPGRCEVVPGKPRIICDGAQNRASARVLRDTLNRNFGTDSVILVLGVSRDKDVKGICEELMPVAKKVIITKYRGQRAENPKTIEQHIRGREVIITTSVADAMKAAYSVTGNEATIVVTGSFFVVAEAKDIVAKRQNDFQKPYKETVAQ